MFLATFQQTSGLPFKADKNGNFPFIGTVKAGTARGTIINGTMFQREGLIANKLYACENHVDPEFPDNVQVEIVTEVSILEYSALRTQLGAPKVSINASEEVETAQAEIV